MNSFTMEPSIMANYSLDENYTLTEDDYPVVNESVPAQVIDYCKDHIQIIRSYNPYYGSGKCHFLKLKMMEVNSKLP